MIYEEDLLNALANTFSDSEYSDSSSSDDEFDFVLDDDNHVDEPRRKKPRVENFIPNVIDRYNDNEFKENFRMSRATFQRVLEIIRPHLERVLFEFGNKPIAADKQFYITLYYLGAPDSYRSIINKFDVGKAAAWRAVKRVVRALCIRRDQFICWPTAEEALETAQRVQQNYGFPGVIGAVDGTLVEIASPNVDANAYIDRHGHYSIQTQVVADDRLRLLHVFTGAPGSVHDSRVFKYSNLQQRCNNQFFPANCHLLGDKAYELQEPIMVGYRDNGHLTVEDTFFNKRLSSARMIVERAIGLLKGRFRILYYLPMRRTDLIPYYILACCILHNICLMEDDDFDFEFEPEHFIDQDVEGVEVPEAARFEGNEKRDRIRNRIAN